MTMSPVEIERKVRQLDGDVQAIYEMLATIEGTQRRHSNRFQEITEQIDERFASLDGRMDALDWRMNTLDGKFAALDGRFASLDGKMGHRPRTAPQRTTSFRLTRTPVGAVA